MKDFSFFHEMILAWNLDVAFLSLTPVPIIIQILYQLNLFILNLASFCYVFFKFFRLLCYLKITIEWFPLLNPYRWPFSLVKRLTGFYFKFWSLILPKVVVGDRAIHLSKIIALEALNSFLHILMHLSSLSFVFLNELQELYPSLFF